MLEAFQLELEGTFCQAQSTKRAGDACEIERRCSAMTRKARGAPHAQGLAAGGHARAPYLSLCSTTDRLIYNLPNV